LKKALVLFPVNPPLRGLQRLCSFGRGRGAKAGKILLRKGKLGTERAAEVPSGCPPLCVTKRRATENSFSGRVRLKPNLIKETIGETDTVN